MTSLPRGPWDDLLTVFFGAANQLEWPNGPAALEELVGQNEALLERDPPGPFVLPLIRHDGSTRYVAFAVDDATGQELRRMLTGVVGSTYTIYSRRITEHEADEPVRAAIRFAGDSRRVFEFTVGQRADRAKARQQVGLLLQLLDQRPDRHVGAKTPIGRLLRDFERALRVGDERSARKLLWKDLLPTGHLSGLNRWFLEVRFLATFERWRELALHSALSDLLRVSRPALVSDALALLAIHQLDEMANPDEQGSAVRRARAFEQETAGRYGALIPTVDAIRSVAGAEYYVLWQLMHGDTVQTVQARLSGLGWSDHERLAPYWAYAQSRPSTPPSPAQVLEAEASGQYERALEIAAQLPPDRHLLPVVVRACQQLLTRTAFDEIDRYRAALGDVAVEEVVRSVLEVSTANEAPDEGTLVRRTWPERVREVLTGERSPADFETDADEGTVIDLLADQRELSELVDALEDAAGHDQAGQLIDGAIRLLRRLDDVGGAAAAESVRNLRRAVIELWAIGDESGDVSRAEEVIDEVEATLANGLSVGDYGELVTLLRDRWAPFLTDRAFGLSVRAIELLAGSRPPDDRELPNYAALILQRVSHANVGRLDRSDLLVAESLSDELGLGLDVPSQLDAVDFNVSTTAPPLMSVGLYSLDEQALTRARAILGREIPYVEVSLDHSRVATKPLRAMVGRVDLMVVADRAAKHAATDAIRAARGARPLVYSAGKGSSSLVRAVFGFISDIEGTQAA